MPYRRKPRAKQFTRGYQNSTVLTSRGRDIALQFLAEAVVMTVCGGAVGILAGVGASTAVAAIAGWPTHVSALAVLLASSMSAAVGIVFGLYPALRAAALDAVEAVHFE
jgi:putative ABC transport system permease protein